MGHRRLGILPRNSRRWNEIAHDLELSLLEYPDASQLTSEVLTQVRDRFAALSRDDSVVSTMRFLLTIGVAAKSTDIRKQLADSGIHIDGELSPIKLTIALNESLQNTSGSLEYREISRGAAADALATWMGSKRTTDPSLFPEHTQSPDWSPVGTGSGFCEVTRIYFAKLTERYTRFFFDRLATESISDPPARDRFNHALRAHLTELSSHAFETSRIAQSFAAGWFNNNTTTGLPSDRKIRGFLKVAFNKIGEELRREGAQ